MLIPMTMPMPSRSPLLIFLVATEELSVLTYTPRSPSSLKPRLNLILLRNNLGLKKMMAADRRKPYGGSSPGSGRVCIVTHCTLENPPGFALLQRK